MQRVSRASEDPRRRHSSVRRTRRPEAPATLGAAGAVGLATLAPPCLHTLPTLDGAALEYNHEEGATLLYELCAGLVREGFGTVESWKECGKKCLVFAQNSIMRRIGEERWNLFKRNVEFHLAISDSVESYGDPQPLPGGRLAVTIECSGCGYLKIGPAIEALEKESEGLGAAFYWEFIYSCYRLMRIYDHEDALQYEEGMREMAEGEADADQQYELPEVEKALPECIRRDLKVEYRGRRQNARCRLHQAQKSKHKSWLLHLRRMQRLARLNVGPQREYLDTFNYDSPPLPSLLVAFEERDAITACFDEEGQQMLEGSSEPALLVFFDPKNPTEVRNAIRSVTRFLLFNQELFELAEELTQWEKDHGSTPLDRSDSSVRTA